MSNLMSKEQFELASRTIDSAIGEVLSSNAAGFQKAFVMSSAISVIKEQLTDEYMKPIMALQGTSLGFKTDLDTVKVQEANGSWVTKKGPGYPIEIVRNCLMEATFLGLEVTGNQFNIIGENMYPTREGFGWLLDRMKGLKKNFTYVSINQPAGQKTATVKVRVDWQFTGEIALKQEIEFHIKSNQYTSYDALIGKAERKAKRWLFNNIKGTDISDGDVNDIPHVNVEDSKTTALDEIKALMSTANLNASENDDLQKIVDGKEVASYDKAIAFLKTKQPKL